MEILSNPLIEVAILVGLPTLLSLGMFIRVVKTDPRTLRLGRWGLLSIFFIFVCINLLLLYLGGSGKIPLAVPIYEGVILVVGFLILSLILFIGIIVESIKIWRRESHSLANLLLPLTFILLVIAGQVVGRINSLPEKYELLKIVTYMYPFFLIYIGWQFLVFFSSTVIYSWLVRRAQANYFVVLGAGLINGNQVGKLLAARIKAASDHAKIQAELPEIIYSGGQGPNETVSEAYAMREYAVKELDYPLAKTILEDKSRTTYENLVFSSKIVKEKANNQDEKLLFFTSEYHVFRAALISKKLGLKAQGLGGKTALYYRIPAFIREFIAVLNMEKKKHIINLSLIFSINIILILLARFTAQ
ncbi:YdcF family protein [Streptococcaceae bacterium ESL0687]|nr:YdcF family protein [Streptococcaceae bacterium ESL0687]